MTSNFHSNLFVAAALKRFDMIAAHPFPKKATCFTIESFSMSTFWQSASYVLCAEPCACTFLLIFDVYLLDIPPPRAEPPRYKFTFKLTFDL